MILSFETAGTAEPGAVEGNLPERPHQQQVMRFADLKASTKVHSDHRRAWSGCCRGASSNLILQRQVAERLQIDEGEGASGVQIGANVEDPATTGKKSFNTIIEESPSKTAPARCLGTTSSSELQWVTDSSSGSVNAKRIAFRTSGVSGRTSGTASRASQTVDRQAVEGSAGGSHAGLRAARIEGLGHGIDHRQDQHRQALVAATGDRENEHCTVQHRK